MVESDDDKMYIFVDFSFYNDNLSSHHIGQKTKHNQKSLYNVITRAFLCVFSKVGHYVKVKVRVE